MLQNSRTKDWNPELYLKFKDERTQPSIDLTSRIKSDNPAKIIDIGCGPGNSTQILYNRWPESEITGLDNSPEMIKKAKKDFPDRNWILSDASGIDSTVKYDIVFSNATIQWIPDHPNLFKKLFAILENKGALAVQIPMFKNMPLGKSIQKVAGNDKWNKYTAGCDQLFTYHDYSFYYDLLSKYTDNIDIWETSYIHIMDSHYAIAEWIKSTGLKPYLDKLESDEMKKEFDKDILDEIKIIYPLQKNKKVLFPFIRLFFIAYI